MMAASSAQGVSRLRRAVYLYGGQAIRIAATLALIPALGRSLGPAGFGVYAVANSIALLVWQVVEFGIPLIASRLYAQARNDAQRDTAYTLASFGRLVLVPLALAAGAGVAAASPALDGHLGVVLLACLLGVQSGLNFGWLLTAIGASRLQSFVETAPAVITLAACLAWVRAPGDVAVVLAALNGAAFFANTIAWFFARRQARLRTPRVSELVQALRSGRAVFFYRMALMALMSGSPYIVAFFAEGPGVGHFALADRLLSAAAGLLQPLTVAVFPESMRLFAESPAAAARVYARFSGRVAVAALLAVAGVVIGGPVLIPLAMGAHYEASVGYLSTLIWALPAMALSQMVVSCILYPLHRDGAIGIVYVGAAAALAAGALVAVPSQGVAAMAAVRVAVEWLVALVLCLQALRAVRQASAAAGCAAAVGAAT